MLQSVRRSVVCSFKSGVVLLVSRQMLLVQDNMMSCASAGVSL